MRLEEFLRGELTPQRLPPAWVTPTHFVFQADDGGLAVLDTTNDTITTLVTNHTLVSLKFVIDYSSVFNTIEKYDLLINFIYRIIFI